uniref:C-type lectin domain-containing protein n=1 Tax=Clytia hemisphaerica TaxID=252671 RepID=A0A7M5UW84_9CNID
MSKTVIYRLYSLQRYVVYTDKVDWFKAERNCKRIGGELLTINDKKEHDFIFKVLKKKFALDEYWIGLNDIAKDFEFVWSGQPKKFVGYVLLCGSGRHDTSDPHCFAAHIWNGMCLCHKLCSYRKAYICENRKPLKLKART